jgi:hypothetical protein
MVQGLEFRVQGLGFRVLSFGFRVSGFGFRVSGFGFLDLGLACRVTTASVALRPLRHPPYPGLSKDLKFRLVYNNEHVGPVLPPPAIYTYMYFISTKETVKMARFTQ